MTNRLSRDDLLQLRQQGFLVHLDADERPEPTEPRRTVVPLTAADREEFDPARPPLRLRRRTDFET